MKSSISFGNRSMKRWRNSAVCDLTMLAPPPMLTVSQWADAHRRLSSESSAEPGRWYTERAEYQRGIMDAVTDPMIESVAIMSSAQIGKTEILQNIIGYYIDQDPSPMLMVQPTIEMAQAYSKDRLAPMIRDTETLGAKVREVKSRDTANTILHKVFPGGHLTMAGANSGASLASRPVRIVLCDEVDRYPVSAGTEGDPVSLAFKRANNFWNRKLIMCSTPTIRGLSRIEKAYEQSDQRKFFVACPHCDAEQVLTWAQVRWPSPKGEGRWAAPEHRPGQARYLCAVCAGEIAEADKLRMVAGGHWRATKPGGSTAGFWLNELYSPWCPLARMVERFLAVKDDPEQLRTFVNTSWAETWEEELGEVLDEQSLVNRRESYGPGIPMGAAVLTAGVDVQDDRIEAELKGWGKGEESWGIEHRVFHGDTTDPKGGAWKSLDEWLLGTWPHASGAPLTIACTMIDSGHRTKEVYVFVKPRQVRRVYASKGSSERGKPIISRPSVRNLMRVKLFPIGTDTAKATLYSRLKKTEFGPGYLHFPMSYDSEYFLQLAAEKRVTTYRKGWATTEWVKIRPRNEAIDLTVLNLAALAVLNANLDRLVDHLAQQAESAHARAAEHQAGSPAPPPAPDRAFPSDRIAQQVARPRGTRRCGFVKGWR